MKVSAFHLMPYRDLPDDFEKKYPSSMFTIRWSDVGNAEKVHQYYNWTLDELLHAAKVGFDGVCTNEHHQNVYGFMVNPNLMGSVLAKMTEGSDTAIIQMGQTAVFVSPPIRVAEEYAMLDCLSGGRLVAGMPVGLGGDFSYSYGYAPMEQRERYYEAQELIMKAWTAEDIFAWNGKYYQLPMVNLWPRPLQQPHPPIWVPGSGSPGTWDFTLKNDRCYCFLTFFGAKAAEATIGGYWEHAEKLGKDRNPYRFGYLIPVGVAETDAEAEKIYSPHVEYFYHKLLHTTQELMFPPGHLNYQGLKYFMTQKAFPSFDALKELRYGDFCDKEFVVIGSAETVRERLLDLTKRLRIGNLMVLPQFGSMPHEQVMENIDRFAAGVLPHLRNVWDDEGWENHWWPKRNGEAIKVAA